MAAKANTITTEKTIRPIYVVCGKDRRRAADAVAQLTEKVLEGADPQLSLSSYEGPSAELAEVLDSLRTAPFLSPRRVVVVKEADPFISQYRQELEKYLESPSGTGVLILMAESFPSNTRLAKRTAAIGEIVACEPLRAGELVKFLMDYAVRQHGLSLKPEAANLLIVLGGDEAGQLVSEVDKLAAYLATPGEGRKAITVEDVAGVVGNNRHYSVFNVIDAMTAGNTARALTRLDQMLAQDRDAQYTAVGAFAWHFRRLHQARLMASERVADQAIIKQLRIWSQAEQFMRQVKRLSLESIEGALRGLLQVDLVSKRGTGTVRTGLEKLIIEFGRSRAAGA
jgi:DNA polymerase III subunit delta